jgi:CRISPR-associated protein Cmr1
MTQPLRKISVRLQTVTPLWMGGAGFQPELRPPSIRGYMRFWLRALLGGALGENLPSLLQAEGAVFGNTQRASPVVVRTDSDELRVGPATVSDEQFPGVAYMFWSTYQRRRDAILPGETFDLHVDGRARDLPSVDVQGATIGPDDVFHYSAAALWLLLRLGGGGARVRRGAGFLQASASPAAWPESVPSPVIESTTPEELAVELASGLRAIRRSLPWQTEPPQAASSFDILHPSVSRISVVDRTFPTWLEATDWVGQQLLEFRRSHTSDASAIAELLTRGRTAVTTIRRAVLGLPIVFFIKSIFRSLIESGVPAKEARRRASASVVPNRRLGRASPLWLRIAPLAGESPRFVVIMMLFRSRFLPDRQMSLRPQDRSIRPTWVDVPTDHALIDQWFDFVSDGGAELKPVAFDGENQHA